MLASIPKEYNSLVDVAKVYLRTRSLTVTELNKQLKELYTRLKRQHKWTDDETAMYSPASQVKCTPQKDLRADAHFVEKWGMKMWTTGKEKKIKANTQRIRKAK